MLDYYQIKIRISLQNCNQNVIVGWMGSGVNATFNNEFELVHGEVYSIQHDVKSLSVICGRSVVFSGHSGFLHQ
jgi:hypothetical protein